MIVNWIDYLRQHLQAFKLFCFGLVIAIVLWSVIAVPTEHAEEWFERIPAFWSIFAFLSIVVLIYFGTWLGKSGIWTREDYYDN